MFRLTKWSPVVTATLQVIGRLGLTSLFLLGGLNKVLNYQPTLDMMAAAGLPFVEALLPLVILLELGGCLLVAVGRWMAPLAALALAGFTLMTNVVFHDFWTMEGERASLELSLFFKNVAIAGALVFVASASAKEVRA